MPPLQLQSIIHHKRDFDKGVNDIFLIVYNFFMIFGCRFRLTFAIRSSYTKQKRKVFPILSIPCLVILHSANPFSELI